MLCFIDIHLIKQHSVEINLRQAHFNMRHVAWHGMLPPRALAKLHACYTLNAHKPSAIRWLMTTPRHGNAFRGTDALLVESKGHRVIALANYKLPVMRHLDAVFVRLL